MKCCKCNASDTKVIESREVAEGQAIRRRRECILCKSRFTTYERLEKVTLVVIKNNGNRELFNPQKLASGILRSTEKTPVTTLDVEKLVAKIEQRMLDMGEIEVSSKQIGTITLEELSKLNEVAYIRFASVYRRFHDVDSFELELKNYKHHKTD